MFGDVGEETLLGDIETMTCFGISGVAGAIWHSTVKYGDKDAVFHHLSRCYEVNDQVLRRDLDTFIGDLLDKGLLIKADDGSDATG